MQVWIDGFDSGYGAEIWIVWEETGDIRGWLEFPGLWSYGLESGLTGKGSVQEKAYLYLVS